MCALSRHTQTTEKKQLLEKETPTAPELSQLTVGQRYPGNLLAKLTQLKLQIQQHVLFVCYKLAAADAPRLSDRNRRDAELRLFLKHTLVPLRDGFEQTFYVKRATVS